MESLLFEPEIVNSLFLQRKHFILFTFNKIGNSSPPPAVIATLARISLFPHLRIAYVSLEALHCAVKRDPRALTLLPRPIFPSSSPHQQYSGFSFLRALPKKLRIVISEFQAIIPADPSHLQKYVQLTKYGQLLITCSLHFCCGLFKVASFRLLATRIKVDPKILRELNLFLKEVLTQILTTISNIDDLIASLPSDSSPTVPLISGVHMQTIESLNHLRNECVKFVRQGWDFIGWIALEISYPYYPSSHTILLDDPSFPDLVLNSLKLQSQDTSRLVLMAITSIAAQFDHLKEKFVKVKLVGRMFETVDFVSLPLSESQTLLQLTDFIDRMFIPIGVERQIRFEQYRLIRVSVFEPAKQFIVFMFKNSSKLVLRKESKTRLDYNLCRIHNHVSGMELRPDKQDGDLVSELVKYEMRTMVEMEKESNCLMILESMLNKTNEWNRNKPERQKRREVLLREEGWDDALELRVVGMETITDQRIRDDLKRFRVKMAFNVNKF